MSEIPHDIKDDEIRIITSRDNANSPQRRNPNKKRRFIVVIYIVAAIICLAAICCVVFGNLANECSDKLDSGTSEVITEKGTVTERVPDSIVQASAGTGFVSLSDTVINKVSLSIFKPINLSPTLQIGTEVLNDSTARLVVQAADVRGDNGMIVGAYVSKGELISKGQTKSGFCAIIGGKINIGAADATPFLEEALETDGYFFRQYPLVVANQIVENKPKGKSLRKALAELNGEPVVIMSRERMTFHDFSQSLVDLGVTNAIYLVGSNGYGFAVDEDGTKIEFGERLQNMHPNTNYIVWR